jgi:hypothetical protein
VDRGPDQGDDVIEIRGYYTINVWAAGLHALTAIADRTVGRRKRLANVAWWLAERSTRAQSAA